MLFFVFINFFGSDFDTSLFTNLGNGAEVTGEATLTFAFSTVMLPARLRIRIAAQAAGEHAFMLGAAGVAVGVANSGRTARLLPSLFPPPADGCTVG